MRHLNPQEKDPQRIKRDDKQYVDKLNYNGITFPVSQKQYRKIQKQNSIKINVFGYKERDIRRPNESPIKHRGRKEALRSNEGLYQVHVQPIKA